MTSAQSSTVLDLMRAGALEGYAELVERATVADDPAFATARHVHAVWDAMAGGEVPDHSRLDPLNLGVSVLPSIVLLDVLGGGADYRWRLFGSRHVEEYGADLTGKTVSELKAQNASAEALKGILDAATRSARPRYFRLTYFSGGELKRQACGVLLPLRKGVPEIEVLLGATTWSR